MLNPWRSVTVRAVGELLSGTWWVDTVHTVLSEQRLVQTFAVSRDALEPRGDEEFGRVPEGVLDLRWISHHTGVVHVVLAQFIPQLCSIRIPLDRLAEPRIGR